MSSSSLEEVRMTVGMSLVRGSAPSRATTISFAIFAWRSARVVSSSSSGLSSTSKIILSDINFPLFQQIGERLGRCRLGEEITLAFVAVVLAQEGELLRGLHAFGEHTQAEAVAHGDDRLRKRRVAPAFDEARNERPVDLQAVDRQAGEVGEARIAGAEVVHRNLHAEPLEVLQHAQRPLAIVD